MVNKNDFISIPKQTGMLVLSKSAMYILINCGYFVNYLNLRLIGFEQRGRVIDDQIQILLLFTHRGDFEITPELNQFYVQIPSKTIRFPLNTI